MEELGLMRMVWLINPDLEMVVFWLMWVENGMRWLLNGASGRLLFMASVII